MSSLPLIIVNPASAGGATGRAWPGAASALRQHFGPFEVAFTKRPGEAAEIAEREARGGRALVVACGGDGTISNTANAIIASGADVRLALVALGTGNDFYKTVGAPARDLDATARMAVEGPDVRVDVGRADGRYFLNVCGFGFNIAVLEDVRTIRWLTGPALYNYSALRQLFFFAGTDVEVTSPTGRRREHLLLLLIANGRHYGGTFRMATRACLTDGRLDLVAFRDGPPLRRARLFAAAIAGTHPAQPEVTAEQADRFTVRFDAPPAFEIDGDYYRARAAEVTVECVPKALRVVTAAPNLC